MILAPHDQKIENAIKRLKVGEYFWVTAFDGPNKYKSLWRRGRGVCMALTDADGFVHDNEDIEDHTYPVGEGGWIESGVVIRLSDEEQVQMRALLLTKPGRLYL